MIVNPRTARWAGCLAAWTCVALSAGASALAQTPGEVTNVLVGLDSTVSWTAVPGADDYNAYRGLASQLASGTAQCHEDEIDATSFVTPEDPVAGQAFVYLITAESNLDGEGGPGTDSLGAARDLLGACDEVVAQHVALRLGYGPDEWTRDRIETLGVQGFIDEQLDPAAIDESTNTELNSRTATLDPPDTIQELVGLDLVNAVYARRQLEQQTAIFWHNHFNTEYAKVRQSFNGRPGYTNEELNFLAVETQYRELQQFRSRGFGGSFREIVEDSALSPAMIFYLDTDANVFTSPNENYARELLELYTMGVNGGYDQLDIEELSRVLTGWNVCKKTDANKDDFLGPCIAFVLESLTAGTYVPNFDPAQHDTGVKVLFSGTPYEVTIGPNALPEDGVNDLFAALDAIANHPSTPAFISTKLLQKFVTEQPGQAQVDAAVAAWNDAGNPAGVGDLREVLRTVVNDPGLRDPDQVGSKLKTPLEHVASTLRAVRGLTNGGNPAIGYLVRMQQIPHANPVPTGYSELGEDWVDTNGLLERQNYGMNAALSVDPNFGNELIDLMADNGLTAGSDPADIVDFWSGQLFGGALTAAELQEAITYLTTDDNGVSAPVDDNRIRETVGFMLGYPQFIEQ